MEIHSRPQVQPRNWISVGKEDGKDAVVCNVFEEHIEVVYLDDRERAINEEVVWNGDCWKFKHQEVRGGYADKYSRFSEFVSILRRGPYA